MKPPICTTPSSWLSPWNTTNTYTCGTWELLSARLRQAAPSFCQGTRAALAKRAKALLLQQGRPVTPSGQGGPGKPSESSLDGFENTIIWITSIYNDSLISISMLYCKDYYFFLLENDSVWLIMTTSKILICTHSHNAKFKTIHQNKHQTAYIGLR